jgi:hypothetical protein
MACKVNGRPVYFRDLFLNNSTEVEMQRVLRIGAIVVFAPLLACCALAFKFFLAIAGFVCSLAGWEFAWPPVSRIDLTAAGELGAAAAREAKLRGTGAGDP